MSETERLSYSADDGSTYRVEVAPPEADDALYGVDMVRASMDAHGLEHEQRLRLGAYLSWGEAEEHQREVETTLEKDGLDGLGDDARRVAQMPYTDGQYLAVVYPLDGLPDDGAKVHLLHLTGQQVTTLLVAEGRTQAMDTVSSELDQAWAEGSDARLLDAAHERRALLTTLPLEKTLEHTMSDSEALPNIEPNITEMDTERFPTMPLETAAPLNGAAWFENTFDQLGIEPLHPLDTTVNYAVVVQDVDPQTLELAVEKYWREPDNTIGMASLTLDTFNSATEQDAAAQAREELLDIHDQRGLETMLHAAELTAMATGHLDGNRADTRLFTAGPPDRFETLAQQLENEINPYWNTDGEKIEEPAPQSGVENPYWRLDPIPVHDPDGEPLGQSLHMVVYPGVERDPDAVGSPAMPADEPFRMLEMAHFETPEAADKFGKEFKSYLVPGLLEGPEMAEQVALLEGFSPQWKTLEGDALKEYQNAKLTLTRDPSDWHPYNPNAEREARLETEGVYTDPIQVLIERDTAETATEPDIDF